MTSKNNTSGSDDGSLFLDGSLLEGGGQAIRNSVSFAGLLGRDVTLFNIRHSRKPRDGLRAQHLVGIKLVHIIYGGMLEDAKLYSTKVRFNPGKLGDELRRQIAEMKDGDDGSGMLRLEANIETAGSVMLLMQISLPCLLFVPRKIQVTFRGGTNAIKAPLVDYTMIVFLHMFHKAFSRDLLDHQIVNVKLHRRGFFPRGGGLVDMVVTPLPDIPLPCFDLTERGNLVRISCRVIVCGLPAHIGTRMLQTAQSTLKSLLTKDGQKLCPIEIEVVGDSKGYSKGISLLLVAETSTGMRLATTAIGERGVSAEEIAGDCAQRLFANALFTGCLACVDQYMQDQLVVFMALANGKSRMATGALTLHTRTAMHWAEYLTGAKFNVIETVVEVESSVAEQERKINTTPLRAQDHSDFNINAHSRKNVIIECVGIGHVRRCSMEDK